MRIALLVLIAVMAFAAVGFLAVAVSEFVISLRSRRGVPTAFTPPPSAQAPPPLSETLPPERLEELKALPPDAEAVVFGAAERKTLDEEYASLGYDQKRYFDRLASEIEGLPGARIKRGKFARTVMQGRDTIARLYVSKGETCLDCTLVNPALKHYGRETGARIKSKPLKFRVSDAKQLEAAVFTLRLANTTALEARGDGKKEQGKKEGA